MNENPLNYSDLFDFSDNGGIKAAIKDIRSLKNLYKEFTEQVTAGQFKMLSDQQSELAKTVRELADASKDLNITQKATQKQLLENAAAMSKLEAENKKLNETRKASQTVNDAVKGSVDQLTAQLKSQLKEYNALGQSKDKDIQKSKILVQSINQTRAQLATLSGAVRQNITAFTAAAGSYNALDAETKKLIVDLKNLPNAFGENARKAKEMQNAINANVAKLKEFDKQMNITNRNVGNYASAFSQIGGSILSMVGPLAIFTASLAGLKRIVTTNAEISDSLSDVRRTAQLTEQESSELVKTLKQIDTRTSLKGLLDISIIAGQLGIAKKDIADFTQSIDQLAVVLSGEIPGGAEEVATALGKINGVFETQKKDGTSVAESYNKTGSAILALGQAGLATGGYLQDFALRTAGVANTARISLPTILAYSAVLEETGSSAEVAGTAFNRLVGNLASKRDKFFTIAKIADANLTIKEFTDLINTDANAALQLFFKGLNAGGKNLTTFTDLLGEIKIKAGPAQNAIIALAQNQELLNTRIKQSESAYNDGSLAAEQFELKNNNLAGSLDKLGNAITNITTNPDSNIGKFFKYIVDTATDAIEAIEGLASRLRKLNDDLIIKRVQRGGFTLSSQEDINAAFQRRRESNTAAVKDEIRGRGFSIADMLAAGKNEVQLRKTLAIETQKQADAAKRLNYNLAYIKDPKNIGEPFEAATKKTNKLRVSLFQQAAVVERLTQLTQKYNKVEAGDGDTYKPEGKTPKGAKGKSAEQLEKENIQRLDRLYQANSKYQIALTELEFTQGNGSAEQQIKLEETKLRILNGSFEDRLALYKKDTAEYIAIQTEQTEATISSTEKVNKIKQQAQEAELRRIEGIARAQDRVNKAQSSKNDVVFESNVRKDVASGKISEEAGQETIYEYYRALNSFQLEQYNETLKKLEEGSEEYLSIREQAINIEKQLIKDATDYEIEQLERAKSKQQEKLEFILEAVQMFGNAAFEINSSFNQANQEELQAQYDKDIAAAGNNAEAKKKIEEDYQRKQLQLKRRQAIADKAEAIFNIGINTAVAVSKALAQTGVLSPFVIPGIIVAGALQAAIVLAKPLPKYKGGRNGGKAEMAIVNDGAGPELLEKNGKFRIANAGKEGATFLQEGEKVHTAEKTAEILNGDKFLDSLIMGTNVVRNNEAENKNAIANAIRESKLDPEMLQELFADAIENLPFSQVILDERGLNRFEVRKQSRINSQNIRNTTGGNG